MAVKEAVFADLQREMRACTACLDGGHWVEPPAVTQGHVDALMMTIGQAPGITEVEVGRPFNAGSGTRLFEWLSAAGIDEAWFRTTQYMTSVTKCYPGRAKGGGGDRVPSRAEQKLCRHFLDRERHLVDARLIMPIGRLAIELYFDKKLRLNEIIGTEMRWANGAVIVPLPHPSGASRWHQIAENQALIERAIALIRGHYQRLFPQA
jgi:uracil-DNA glycosylase